MYCKKYSFSKSQDTAGFFDAKALIALVLFTLAPALLWAQTQIRGMVKDKATGQGLPFVSIMVKGTTTGSTTDVNGNYELTAPANARQLQFSFLGYATETKSFEPGRAQTLNVTMREDDNVLAEVVIRPQKEKYRNKNNPAVELIRQVIKNKSKNRIASYDYVSYQEYEKMQLAMSNMPESLKRNFLFKKFRFVFDNVDTTKVAGRALLPLYLEENITEHYLQKNPQRKKSIITGTKRVSFDESYVNNDNLGKYLKHLYQDVDLYENNVYLLTNSFLSPISDMSPTFYKFYITDTVADGDLKLVELSFVPRNKNDFLFMGKMYITLDGNYGVQKANLGVSKDINLNWVNGLDLTLEYERGEDGRFHPSKSTLLVNFGLYQSKKGMFGERIVNIRNFSTQGPLPDSIFKGQEVVRADSSLTLNDRFWEENRPEALTAAEAQTYKNMDSLNNMKSFKRMLSWASMFLAGYKVVGPVEIGPVSTFYSFNPVEGFRLRFGGRTTTELSRRYYTEAYGAYGFKDNRWKFFLSGTYSINDKSIYNYPLNYVRASFQRETSIPGQELQFMQEDNFLLSFKRGLNDRWMYNDIFRLEYVYEFGDHFSVRAQYKNWKQEAAGGLHFIPANDLHDTIPSIRTSELGLEWRWAPREQFFQRKLYRTPIYNAYPIITARFGMGIKDFLGGQYDYQTARVNIFKRLYLSQLGFADINLGGGYIFGKVPYPLLDIARANQTYAYQLNSFSLMNFLEFVSDKYVGLNIDYHMYGFIFNKVPLFKMLKLREVASIKLLYGGVRPENKPSKDDGQFLYPTDQYGNPATFSLEQRPYAELSIGVENILNLIRIDFVKRLNYIDHPNVVEYGVRARINFDF